MYFVTLINSVTLEGLGSILSCPPAPRSFLKSQIMTAESKRRHFLRTSLPVIAAVGRSVGRVSATRLVFHLFFFLSLFTE